MRKPLVVGNWKMHGRRATVTRLAADVVAGVSEAGVKAASVDVVVCPPAVYLVDVGAQLRHTTVLLGAQSVSEFDEGAYTGEVGGPMLVDVGCRYVLVGHSERRSLFGKVDATVAAKFAAAQRAGLTPILCIGESQHERKTGHTGVVIQRQLRAVADRVGVDALATGVIAYEPIWAIGTGTTATPAQAQEVHRTIRTELGAAGAATRILYGGSVRAGNAKDLLAEPDIDGALVGGASLDAEEFNAICRTAGHN